MKAEVWKEGKEEGRWSEAGGMESRNGRSRLDVARDRRGSECKHGRFDQKVTDVSNCLVPPLCDPKNARVSTLSTKKCARQNGFHGAAQSTPSPRLLQATYSRKLPICVDVRRPTASNHPFRCGYRSAPSPPSTNVKCQTAAPLHHILRLHPHVERGE